MIIEDTIQKTHMNIQRIGMIAIGAVALASVSVLQADASSAMPNGLLVRAINDPKVYYIENNQKRHIESPQMLESQFRWDDVVVTAPADLAAVATGPKMTFRDGSLLAFNGTVFVIADGKRRPIESADVFLSKGYKWSNVLSVSGQEISPHPEGSKLRAASDYPDGTLLMAPGGRMYVIEEGRRRYIPSPLIFEARYRWDSAIAVAQSVIDSYPKGSDIFYPDGLLISSATGVYLMDNNRRRPIHSPEIFESYGLNWSKVRRATDFELSIIPRGSAFSQVKTYANNTLLSPDNSPAIYRVVDGNLQYVPSAQVFESYGYNWGDILTLPSRVTNKYSKRGTLGFKDGTLISYGGGVYLIEAGKRRPIPSPQIFTARGFQWGSVRNVSEGEFRLHAQGASLGDVSTASLDGYSIPATRGKTAREQHLARDCNETASQHYSRSGTGTNPSWLRNGLLSSGGAFASRCPSGSRNSSAANASVEEEKYYITMRWNYVNWYEARTTLTSSLSTSADKIAVADASWFPSTGYVRINNELIGYTKDSNNILSVVSRGHDQGAPMRNRIQDNSVSASGASSHNNGSAVTFVYKYSGSMWYPRPFTSLLNNTSAAKRWHANKKVLVTNPSNGKQIVASILESGPAMFTDRVSGLSPEAMDALGAGIDTVLEYGFLIDQTRPVGPIN